ncbi:MAG: hypothetical protein L0215_03845 [Gemmataceae bacterium]|nr:hypothetical protein [Gemmataceae bacterium]
MARAKSGGNGRLEEALATLIQNQAAFVARMAEIDQRVADMDRVNSERFARIEGLLVEHNRILTEHTHILQALTDAVREKIGFKLPEKP